MSDTSTKDFYTRQAKAARGPETHRPPGRSGRHKRLKRILIASGASLVVLIGAVVGGGYLMVNNLASKVHRIPNIVALDAKNQPAAASASGGITVLLTASGVVPSADTDTGLIELLHLNGDHGGGGVVSFPANLLVSVPGHGKMRLGQTLTVGGPSLMIETLERLTNVRINHYSRITFSGLPSVVGSMNGVNVVVPYTVTSMGFTFHAGVNRLNSANTLAYVRQPAVGQVVRTELQQNLLRAILNKIATHNYFLATDYQVLDAVVAAVSVDSSLSNSQLESLALQLGHLERSDGVSIDVPTKGSPNAGYTQPITLRTSLARKLWRAIKNDSLKQFARQYPSTVTPGAPG
jgi:LCP family protein required for cell wall assembly